MGDLAQSAASAGVRVPPEATLTQLLDAIDLRADDLVWRAEYIAAVIECSVSALVTGDARLARRRRLRCAVELVQ